MQRLMTQENGRHSSFGYCNRCGALVIFRQRGRELCQHGHPREGQPRRWRMVDLAGGKHWRTCQVLTVSAGRSSGAGYYESCACVPWEACQCENMVRREPEALEGDRPPNQRERGHRPTGPHSCGRPETAHPPRG